jgi:hypothetical protein
MESIRYYVEQIPSIIQLIKDRNISLPDLDGYSFVGSGNAFQVARLYAKHFNGYAYLSEEIDSIKNKDQVCVISASGGKDSIKVVESFKSPFLLTCNPKAKAKSIAGETIVVPSLEEPPFYNVTSYAAMIYLISKSNLEIPKRDNNLISLLNSPSIIFVSDLKNHPIASMCSLKFREILGSLSISLSINEAYHGWFLRPFTREAVISMNVDFDLKSTYKICGNSLDILANIYYHIGILQEELQIKDFEYTKIIEKREWEI